MDDDLPQVVPMARDDLQLGTVQMSSIDFIDTLPGIEKVLQLSQALAALDAILCPEWEYRYFSFNASSGENQKLGSMRNGEGDDWLIFFNASGAVIKGFAHQSTMATDCPWPGVLDHLPSEFDDFREEAAFSIPQTTFCLWRLFDDERWSVGNIDFPKTTDPDGAHLLLPFLDGDPETYRKWGESYYAARINPRAVEHVYRHDPLNPFIIKSLNTDVQLDEVRREIQEIGYPI